MLDSIRNIFSIPDLRRRVLFTLALLAVYRIGAQIPNPGISATALAELWESQRGTILGMVDLFTGRSMSRMTIFALGIMPYISASIILQLLQVVWPYLERLSKEGEMGRKKITQYTRYGTLFICMIQSGGIAFLLKNLRSPVSNSPIVPNGGIGFILMTMLTLTTGTVFIMWLGEQISERGIGNGISLIIFAGIVVDFPRSALSLIQGLRTGDQTPLRIIFLLALMLAVIAVIVFVERGQRRLPVSYAKRVVGRKIYGGQSTHIPLRLNTAGVIPVIFAQAIIMFPGTLANFFKGNVFMENMAAWLQPGAPLYTTLYVLIIIFFAYFYTAIIFNPVDLADNMKKYGGFVPGKRPGKKTAEYIDSVLTRITLPGACFLAFIAVLPFFMQQRFNAPFTFGGTGLLIVVGVGLDTLQQIESHLLMRHYDGFMKKGKLRGRRR